MTEASKQDKNGRRGFLSRAARGASDRVLDIVDPDVVLEHVDVNALLERVDVNTLLDRVDVNALLDRVDVDALLERADVDALMERVDVKALVEKAGIPEIVADSTAHLTGSALDLFRRPIVGLDEIVFRLLNRILGRDVNNFPEGPRSLVDWVDEHAESQSNVSTGRYSGPVTRLLAVVIDGFAVTAGFTLMLAGLELLLNLVSNGLDFSGGRGVWLAVGFVLWVLFYLAISIAIFGKTIGKAVMGVRVVSSDGSIVIRGSQAVLRAVTFPFSTALLGLGLWGIIFGRERRAWHDHAASTAVVYDWGTRTAQMPSPLAAWLERRQTEG